MITWLLIASVGTLLYFYAKWHFSYWERKGFPRAKPKIPFGNLDSVRTRRQCFGEAIADLYKSSREPVLGVYLLPRRALLIRDAQLARDILTKDFASFHDRGVYVDEKNDPLSGGLFFLEGQRWKTMRTNIAPSFSSGKLKAMFGTVESIADKMIAHLNRIITDEGPTEVEIRSVMMTYAIDIVGSSIFGLEVDSFLNPKNEFFELSHHINDPGFTSLVRGICQFLFPTLEKIFVWFGWRQVGPEGIKRIVRRTIEFREKHNVSRRDLLQMLLQLRNTGKVSEDNDVWSAEHTQGYLRTLTVDMIAGHLFLFYVAGYETSASTAAFTLYEMAQYPEVLQKARRDVLDTLAKHDGRFDYDALADMKYLDLCLMETVRKYPGLPILNRICTTDYPIPDSDKVIEQGTPVIISLLGMQRDEKHFPDPMRYHPERYLEENANYNPVAYMPFGGGPRHCVAQRMGKLNVKVALAKLLLNFNIHTRAEPQEIKIATYGIPFQPEGGVPIYLSKRALTDSCAYGFISTISSQPAQR